MQVVTIGQFALLLVHAFPFVPATRELLDAIVSVHQCQAFQPADLPPVALVSGLKKLDQYLKAFTAEAQIPYVPYRGPPVPNQKVTPSCSTKQQHVDMLATTSLQH